METSRPIVVTLRMLSGAIVWVVHFMAIFGFTTFACARGIGAAQWLGVSVVAWAIGAATMIALAAVIVLIAVATRKRDGARLFADWIMAGVAALAGVAIVWETLPVLVVRPCV